MYRTFLKRVLDIFLSLLGVILLSPLLLCLALCVKLTSPGPVFFRQKRAGKSGKIFFILKFRTMRADTPGEIPTHLLENPQAFITPLGGFLRRTSLDELPQLFNILAGQMSLVGPRPALYNQEDLLALRKVHGALDIKPGLTGWAQINGRDMLALDAKARLDGEYAARYNLGMDLRCLFSTVGRVLRREAIAEGKQPEEQQHTERAG